MSRTPNANFEIIPKKTLGLYLHFPFCAYKCGYCDFNSWVEQTEEPQVLWLEALKKELRFWRARGLDDFAIDTIFMGGGTPSLLKEKLWFELADFLRANVSLSADCEWTVEANPETVTSQLLKNLREGGANRLSIGIQSFQEKYLRRLERGATPLSNRRALEAIAEHWQGRWSLDLMFGLPEQSMADWEYDLGEALKFGSKHISAYQLTLTTEKSKNWKQPVEDELLKYFRYTRENLAVAGLVPYEISNFAVAGEESRHNLKYWRAESFLGLGPGAYSILPPRLLDPAEYPYGAHFKNPTNFIDWQKSTLDPLAKTAPEKRSSHTHATELLLVGLRLEQGIERARFPESASLEVLSTMCELLELTPTHLRPTPRGREILDATILRASRLLDANYLLA